MLSSNKSRAFTLKILLLSVVCLFASNLAAQTTTLPPATVIYKNFGEDIVDKVNAQTDMSGISSGAVNLIIPAVGLNGAATFTGLSGNNVTGDGVTGSVQSAWNVTIGVSVGGSAGFLGIIGANTSGSASTQITGNTTVAWTAIAGSDGFVHITITVTVSAVGNTVTRVLDVKIPLPVQALQPLTVTTPAGGGGAQQSAADNAAYWAAYDRFLADWEFEQEGLATEDGATVTLGPLTTVLEP